MQIADLDVVRYTNYVATLCSPTERAGRLRKRETTGLQNLWLGTIFPFSIEFINSLVSPCPRHNRCCGLNNTAATARTTATMQIIIFTILTGAAFVVALVHASTLPQTQPNLRQRQSANGTIQWQPCTYGIAECALFTYVFHNPPS